MSDTPPPLGVPAATITAPQLSLRIPARSLGLKLLLVCGLALLMTIPAVFVFGLLMERTHRAETVAREIGGMVGGPETFLGPVIAVPYSVTRPAAAGDAPGTTSETKQGVYVIYPVAGQADAAAKTDVRKRSLFRVPVYRTDVAFKADFDLSDVGRLAPEGAKLDWSRAEFLFGASDARGAQSDFVLNAFGKSLSLVPAADLTQISIYEPACPGKTSPAASPEGAGRSCFGISAADAVKAGGRFQVDGKLTFTGAQRLSILAFAKTTDVTMRGDWPSPSFEGGFLTKSRSVNSKGYTAAWTVPFIARGVAAEGTEESITRLGQTALAVSFVEPANPYQSVGRSLKYALLFVGLVFLAYFIFETMARRRVHPAQYVLVGLAQVVFYLLLLSLAEQIGFDLGFLVAAGATVGLISAYAGWVFESRRQGVRAFVAFAILYGLIYVLMRLEDYALLVGALASFAAIALVMYFTRRIDWYGATHAVVGETASISVSEEPA